MTEWSHVLKMDHVLQQALVIVQTIKAPESSSGCAKTNTVNKLKPHAELDSASLSYLN